MDSLTGDASDNMDSCHWPENSKWVAEVLTAVEDVDKRWLCVAEMDQNIQKMLKLIEENNGSSAKYHEDNQSADLTVSAKEFHCVYQTLTERYGKLTQELLNSVPPDVQLSGSDHNSSSPVTPKGHLDQLKPGRLPVSFSSGSGSSDISLNVDSDSSSSEFESESEAFYSSLNHHLVSPGTESSQVAKEVESEETAMKTRKQMSYRQVVKKIVEYEEELRIAKLKLQDSEQEIEKLKGEIEKGECAIVLAENLRAELEKVGREIELRDAVIGTEKRRVFELQEQVLDLETKLSHSSLRIESLVSELEVSGECLEVSDAEIFKLREMLSGCEHNFSAEKEKMETDIACLLEKQAFLDARVRELESLGELLEDQIRNSDAEKMEMRASIYSKEAEIDTLKMDITSRAERIETLNKDFDKHKLRYEMLRAEKDEVSAKADNLKAELRSRDIQIGQMEECLNRLQQKQNELMSESGTSKNVAEELRVRVKELEKEVERQRNTISEGEEEKREAIRQLCFSLDHYRSGYRQLVRSLSGNNKRQAAIFV